METKKVECHFCGTGFCGILADVEDGRLIRVKGNPDAPYGRTCGRYFFENGGKAAIEYHYHPDRLKYPLKRIGERGEGKWQRLSWGQAMDEIAAKLRELKEKHGPETLVVGTGTHHMTDNIWSPWRFCNLFKTPNKAGHEQICYGAMVVTDEITFGWPISIQPVPANCYVLTNNLTECLPMQWDSMLLAKKRGAKIISIDPFLTETARISDLWLQIRPGYDTALVLGFINYIITENLFDKEFVEEWTNSPFLVRMDTLKILRQSDLKEDGSNDNFVVWNKESGQPAIWSTMNMSCEPSDTKPQLEGTFTVPLADGKEAECKTVWTILKERVSEYTFDNVEHLTWISKSKLKDAATMYSTLKPSLWLVHHLYDAFAPGSIDVSRAKCILKSVCGNIGRSEAVAGPYHPETFVNDYELELRVDEMMPAEQKKKQIGADRFKMLGFPGYDLKAKYIKKVWGITSNAMWSCQPHPPTLWRSIVSEEPYPIKAAIFAGSNPLCKYGNVKMVYEALEKLDLIVVLDMFITPTAAMADYLIPMTDQFERPAFNIGFGGIFPFVYSGERALKPEYERRDDYDFFRELGIRFGQDKHWPWKTLEEVYDYRIKPESGYKSFKEFVDKKTFDAMPAKRHDEIDPSTGYLRGFATPTRKIEIWSVILEELNYDPLPQFRPPALSSISHPRLVKEYPLTLITLTRHLPQFHSEFYMIHSLRDINPYPQLEIHPRTAAAADPPIADGDWVWIETRIGRVKHKAKLSFGIHPTVVRAKHCWWYPEMSEKEPILHGVWESNINVTTEDDPDLCDPVYGTWPHNALPCKVYKALP